MQYVVYIFIGFLFLYILDEIEGINFKLTNDGIQPVEVRRIWSSSPLS